MVEKLIAEMREQGADDTEIIEALQKMADEGKITPEDFESAKNKKAVNSKAYIH